MPGIAVNVAVIHEGKILLTKREDFETWILPSGGVEEGESVAQAAIRETKEETGLDVELVRLVGIYSRLGNMPGVHAVLFTAKPSGGEIKCQPGETIAVEWFPFDAIPAPLSVGHKKRIEDAISGACGMAVLQEVIQTDHPSEQLYWNQLLELRDKSGLPRQAFWNQLMERTTLREDVEVAGRDRPRWQIKPMNANEVLIDLLEDNRRRLLRVFSNLDGDCLQWKPEPQANSIATTLWHMARILDVFLTRQAKGDPPAEECWFRHGWAAQTGYDPRGLGLDGWGMLTGYTPLEVSAIPSLTREQLLGYLGQVYDAVKEYLAATPEDILLTPAPGFEGKYTRYQCIQMPLMDNVRHLGEVYAIKARWDRRYI